MQEEDSNAAAAALEANFPDTVKKNKRRKAGFSAAAIPALAEAGRGSAQNTIELLVLFHARASVCAGIQHIVECNQAWVLVTAGWQTSSKCLETCWSCFEARLSSFTNFIGILAVLRHAS